MCKQQRPKCVALAKMVPASGVTSSSEPCEVARRLSGVEEAALRQRCSCRGRRRLPDRAGNRRLSSRREKGTPS